MDNPFQTLLDNQTHLVKQVETLTKLIQGERDKVLGPMDVNQAAEYLNAEVSTVRKMAAKNQIPHHKKLGLKFYRHELDQWIIDSDDARTLHVVKPAKTKGK